VPGATSYVFKNVINTNSQPVTLTSTDHIETAVSIGSTYTYQVSACNASGCSASVNSNAVTILAPEPATPTGLTAAVNGSSIIVSWGAVSGATSYTIQKTAGSASNIAGISGTSYTDSSIVANTTYSYKVQACNAAGCSAFSSSVTKAPLPAAPSNVTASSRSGYAYVSWSAVPGATSYVFKNVINTNSQPVTLTSTDHIETAVSIGSTYTYQVSACNASGCSASVNSNAVTILAPEPATPTGLTAAVNGSSIIVSWGAVSGATTYTIQRTAGTAVSNVTGISGSSYTDTGVVANTTYGYKVQACNASGCSAFSSSVTRAPLPAAPSNVTASSRSGYAYVSWSAVPGATSYVLKNVINTNTQPVNVTTTDHIVTEVSIGGKYTYQVSACNASGCSASVNSNEVTIVAPEPGMPTGVKATASGSSIVVSWGAVNGATSYTIQKTVDNVVSNITGVVGTSYTDAGLAPNTTYSYNVKACNSSGCSAISVGASATTPAFPAVPTGITAVVNGTSIVVSWSAVTSATSYTLRKSVGNAVSDITGIAGVSHTDGGVVPGPTYTYSVQACNAAGCSAMSINVSVAVLPPVASVTVSQAVNRIRVSWPAVGNATFYRVTVMFDGDDVTFTNIITTSMLQSGILVDTDYMYNVKACNASGCSPGRDSAKIRIPHIPAPPASLSAIVRQNLIYLTWPNADNATGFELLKNTELISNIGVPSYSDAAVTKGTSYTYKVKACNATGCSAAVATATAVAGQVQAGTNVVEEYDYNVLGRLIKVKENGTVKTQYDYDNAGNRKQVTE
jgi:YD repeat-containing protein